MFATVDLEVSLPLVKSDLLNGSQGMRWEVASGEAMQEFPPHVLKLPPTVQVS